LLFNNKGHRVCGRNKKEGTAVMKLDKARMMMMEEKKMMPQ
jgi:hypothetical protein